MGNQRKIALVKPVPCIGGVVHGVSVLETVVMTYHLYLFYSYLLLFYSYLQRYKTLL